jgi:hypothetical protein
VSVDEAGDRSHQLGVDAHEKMAAAAFLATAAPDEADALLHRRGGQRIEEWVTYGTESASSR